MRDEVGRIENSKAQLEKMDDEKLNEILESSIHGRWNKTWAKEILSERRLQKIETKLGLNKSADTICPKCGGMNLNKLTLCQFKDGKMELINGVKNVFECSDCEEVFQSKPI